MSLESAAKILENELKRIIQSEGLVKSGTLLNSIKVYIYDNDGNIGFEIEAMDYFKYLDDKHNLTGQLIESAAFDSFKDETAEYLKEKILNSMK